MRKVATVLVLLVFLTGSVSALQAELFPVDRTSNEHKAGEYIVQVTNNGTQSTSARVKTQSQCSDCFYVPDSYLQLDPGESKNATVILQVDQDMSSGRYGFTIFASEIGTSQNVRLNDYFRVKRDYSLIFSSFGTDKNGYSPGDSLDISTQIKNIGSRSITDYSINAEFMNQAENATGLDIIREAERSYDFSFSVPQSIEPGTQTAEITIYRNNEIESSITRGIEILPTENVEINETTSNRVIASTTTLNIVNTGNVNSTSELTQSIPSYLAPVTTFEPEPVNVTSNNNSQIYTWSISTAPGDETQVSYTVHYWIPVILLAGLILAVLLYKRLTAGVRFEKHVAKSSEGSITVNIEIENTSNEVIDGLQVVDFIPNIAQVERSFQFAKPSIRKKNEGTELTWSLDNLEPGDQRILEYTIHPQVEVEGEVTLPAAELRDEDDETVQETSKLETDFRP